MNQIGSPLEDWSSGRVIDAIKAKGFTMRELSLIYTDGRSESALGRALYRPDFPAHEEYIAEFLGLKPEQIWPQRWAKRQARAELKAAAKQRAIEIRNKRAA